MGKHILCVVTSHDRLGNSGKKTGVWLEEFTTPYYQFKDAGCRITIASPKGGNVPIDPASMAEEAQTETTRRFLADNDSQHALAQSVALHSVHAEVYDAIFYPGGHGPLWDLATDSTSIALIERFWKQNKPVAAVCHASAVFMDAKDEQGEYIVAQRKVTGFTNAEEDAVGLTDVVPFLVEDRLKARGGRFVAKANWEAYAVQDGLLITGQNPASSDHVATLVMNAIA